MITDVKDIRFRASSMGQLMPGPRAKIGELQVKQMSKLREVYIELFEGRTKDIFSKYIEKGLEVEEDGITLFTLYRKSGIFVKNATRFVDDNCTGHPDIIEKDEEGKAINIPDIKSRWDRSKWWEKVLDEPSTDEYWQGQVYMRLTGAPKASFVSCCLNATTKLIDDAKYQMLRKYNFIDDMCPEAVDKGKEIEINMIFDYNTFRRQNPGYDTLIKPDEWKWDLPMSRRINEKVVERNEGDIKSIDYHAPLWRSYIEKTFLKFNNK